MNESDKRIHWPSVGVATFGLSVASLLFMSGQTFGTIQKNTSHLARIDDQIVILQQADSSLRERVGALEARFDVLNRKLDDILDTVKRKP